MIKFYLHVQNVLLGYLVSKRVHLRAFGPAFRRLVVIPPQANVRRLLERRDVGLRVWTIGTEAASPDQIARAPTAAAET